MLLVRVRSWNASRAFQGETDLLVNIGAGANGKKTGWVNLDGFANQGINCLCDARKGLPFPDNSVRGIFSEHFLEHLDYTEEVPKFLSECYRVLRGGGVLRIIVPDAEKYLRAYAQGGWQELISIRPLDANLKDRHAQFRYNTRMELINVVFRQQQEHKFAYDFETLEFLLKRKGFCDIKRQEFARSINPEMCIDMAARASESLYVEAVKERSIDTLGLI
jgi:predicted SAM-dependent methyltransferase